jgi:hypothetical protein
LVSKPVTAGAARANARLFALLLAVAACIWPSAVRAQDTEILQDAITLSGEPPVFAGDAAEFAPAERPVTIAESPVNLLIAAHKTSTERYSDTFTRSGQRRRRPVATSARLRRADDANFTNRTRYLARRIEEVRSAEPPELATATTGEEFLASLIGASRRGPIANLVVYGHAASTALFMREDRGLYASVGDVARDSQIVSGTDEERTYELRAAGARDLADLEQLIRDGEIRFARNAVIVFAGCGVAGKREVDSNGIAARGTEITGAKVIASIDVTDQSMGRGRTFRNHEYSRRTWVRFVAQQTPERLNTHVIDVLSHLNLNADAVAAGPQPDNSSDSN